MPRDKREVVMVLRNEFKQVVGMTGVFVVVVVVVVLICVVVVVVSLYFCYL